MNMHKNTRLIPHHRQAIWLAYTHQKESFSSLARRYQVSRVTIYRALKAARGRLLKPQNSTNKGSANHAFGVVCYENGIGLKFTRVARLQTDGKGGTGHSYPDGDVARETVVREFGTPAEGTVPLRQFLQHGEAACRFERRYAI